MAQTKRKKVEPMVKRTWQWLKTPPKAGTLWQTLLALFLATLGLSVYLLWFGTLDFSLHRLLFYFTRPDVFLLNTLPVLLLAAFFHLLCNRAWISFLLTAVTTNLLTLVNYFKIQFRGEALIATDVLLLSEGTEAGLAFEIHFPKAFWLGLGFIALATWLLSRYARSRAPKGWLRLCLAFALIPASILLWKPLYTVEAHYKDISDYDYFNCNKNSEFAANRGLFYHLLYTAKDFFPSPPTGYDPAQVEQWLSDYESAPMEQPVNVIFTMLESFSDLSVYDLPLVSDPYETFHALQAESYHGTLIADTVGGGTVNAERSVMTGFTFIHPDYDRPRFSYVRYFSENGYYTEGAHPGECWFYNREPIAYRLGFDRYLFIENYFGQYEASFGEDRIVFPLLRQLYEERKASPYFAFHVTYQNHSPYEDSFLEGREYIAELTGKHYYAVNNYLDGVARTGEALMDFVDSFREDAEPVVLVFFGDHKPTLGEANSAYEALGIDIADGSAEGCYNLYSTPYLIWANDAAKAVLGDNFQGEGPTISPCYLMNLLFDRCGWKGPVWLQYQSDVMQEIPVIHRRTWYYTNGQMTTQIPSEALVKERNRVEYYFRTLLDS